LILLSDVAWALGIALTPMFLARQPRPFTLAFFEYAICGALAASAAAAFEPIRAADFAAGLVPLLYAGVISGGVAFTMQIVAQAYAPPAEAAERDRDGRLRPDLGERADGRTRRAVAGAAARRGGAARGPGG
jgi:hypothetical protein